MKPRLRFLLLFVIIAGLAGAVYWYAVASQGVQAETALQPPPPTVRVALGTVQQSVSAPATVVNTREMALSLPVAGRLATLLVRPGQRVQAGEPLATLDTRELVRAEQQQYSAYLQAQLAYSQTIQAPDPVELAAAQAAVISAQSAYTDLISPPDRIDLAAVTAALHNAQTNLQTAQTRYEASADWATAALTLAEARNVLAIAQAAYDQASAPPSESQRRTVQAQIAAAQADRQKLQPDPAAIAQAQLALDQAFTAWQAAVADRQAITLTAPFTGVVTTIQARLGESVSANSVILLLTDPGALEVEAKVIEEDLPLVQLGQTVEVYFDAAPDLLLEGTVTRINSLRLAGDRPQYGVYIAIDQPPAEVLAGMSSDVAIIIARQEKVLYLPRALVRAGAGGTGQVELWVNGQRQKQVVKVGLRGDVYVEIVEGLQEGDEVVSQ